MLDCMHQSATRFFNLINKYFLVCLDANQERNVHLKAETSSVKPKDLCCAFKTLDVPLGSVQNWWNGPVENLHWKGNDNFERKESDCQ